VNIHKGVAIAVQDKTAVITLAAVSIWCFGIFRQEVGFADGGIVRCLRFVCGGVVVATTAACGEQGKGDEAGQDVLLANLQSKCNSTKKRRP